MRKGVCFKKAGLKKETLEREDPTDSTFVSIFVFVELTEDEVPPGACVVLEWIRFRLKLASILLSHCGSGERMPPCYRLLFFKLTLPAH